MVDPGSSSVPLQPRSIVHLPKELLHLVTSSLDITSAKSLLTTSKLLSEPAEARIWSDIKLTLPHHHGEHPLERPFRHGTHQYWDWAKAEARRAEDRGREDLDLRVKEIMTVSNKRRLGYVKSLKIMARAGSATSSGFFLSCVAPRLESLTIVPPLAHIWDENWQPEYHETFYSRLHDLGSLVGFNLPALRSLDITLSNGIEYNDSILLLLKAAASTLEDLRLDVGLKMEALDDDTVRSGPRWSEDIYTPHIVLSNLRTLSLVSTDTIDYALELALISTSKLRTVTLQGVCMSSDFMEGAEHDFFGHLTTSDVQEVKWTGRHLTDVIMQCTEEESNSGCPGFDSLHTFILEDQRSAVASCIEFTPIPRMPALKTLMVQVPSWRPEKPVLATKSPFKIILNDYRSIPRPLACWLRESADSLQVIQYFPHAQEPMLVDPAEWDAKDCQGAIIRCFYANHLVEDSDPEDTLLHVRSRTYWLTESAFDASYPHQLIGSHSLSYPDSLEDDWKSTLSVNAETKNEVYIHAPDCHWTDMTDYRGHIVPPDVMLRMQRAEGFIAESLDHRDIPVGAIGWGILRAWYDGLDSVKAEKEAARVAEQEAVEAAEREAVEAEEKAQDNEEDVPGSEDAYL